jgi:hypothetical protein
VNLCCNLPKEFESTERGVDSSENVLDQKTLDWNIRNKKNYPELVPENSKPFGPENPRGTGLTSIKGRVAKHGIPGKWKIKIPNRPNWMHPSDYERAVNSEFRTNDINDNIHAGPNFYHSTGCVLLGLCNPNPNQNAYQNSLEADLEFKAAVACAERVSKGIQLRVKVNDLPPLYIEGQPYE